MRPRLSRETREDGVAATAWNNKCELRTKRMVKSAWRRRRSPGAACEPSLLFLTSRTLDDRTNAVPRREGTGGARLVVVHLNWGRSVCRRDEAEESEGAARRVLRHVRAHDRKARSAPREAAPDQGGPEYVRGRRVAGRTCGRPAANHRPDGSRRHRYRSRGPPRGRRVLAALRQTGPCRSGRCRGAGDAGGWRRRGAVRGQAGWVKNRFLRPHDSRKKTKELPTHWGSASDGSSLTSSASEFRACASHMALYSPSRASSSE